MRRTAYDAVALLLLALLLSSVAPQSSADTRALERIARALEGKCSP